MPDYGHDLLFGTFITPDAADPAATVARAQATERAGLDFATFQDHPYQPRHLDTWTLLSWVAASTERLRIAPNVLNLPLRTPSVTARAAASLDLLSGGRVELALGSGAFWDAIEAMGGRRLTPGQAVDALDQAIDVIRALWDAGARGGARAGGEHHRVSGAKRGPAPAHGIGLWVGAYKPRMQRLTGRKADGWLPSLGYADLAALAEGNRVVDAAAREAGRAPGEVRRLLNLTGAEIGPASRGFLQGPPEQWVDELLPLVTEHGFSAFFLATDDPGQIRRYGEEVAPALREAAARERTAPARPAGARPARARAARRDGIDYDAVPDSLAPGAVEPGDREYDRVRHTYMRSGSPGLVLRPADADQAAEALRYAREQRAPLAVRSGGHGISGRSTGDGGVLLDLSRMNRVELLDRGSGLVRIGAGARWSEVAAALAPHGLAIGSGDHGGVGVGGLAITGGLGWTARRHGLTIDHLAAAEVVLADGTRVRADAGTDPDLLWAVRGAGANMGLVASVELYAQEIGEVVFADFAMDAADTAGLLQAWGAAVEEAPRELTSFLRLLPGRRGSGPVAGVQAVYAGDDVEAAGKALAPLMAVGPVLDQQAVLAPYRALMPAGHGPHRGAAEPVMRSALLDHLTAEAAEGVAAVAGSGQSLGVHIRAVGGAVNDVAPDATAYPHRHQNFSLAAIGAGPRVPAMERAWEALLPLTDGMYLSFETGTGPEVLRRAFPEPALSRLRDLKRRYDPDQVFSTNFPIPPADR
ncbi:LLM class flavin-dependent oxidoreductase [Nocardiopsis potens]|uniref:LLM class flavin-dependent oxidoreductase n=1 Tax=Nocardiopsis potens TaxID=1246458 RepID=UPI0003498CD5|nr:LLM class flavin-dependent oxidoreductase [Nocardiopsis potens]